MSNINNIKPVNVRVEELFHLLFGNEVKSYEEDRYIYEVDRERFINRFLVWGSKDITIDKTFIELFIEYTENFQKENEDKYYRWLSDENGLNLHLEALKTNDDPKSSSCVKVCHHILLCAEMVKSYLETKESNTDISEVDIDFLDSIMQAYKAISKLINHNYNKVSTPNKPNIYNDELANLLGALPDQELVAFRCFCQAKINNKELSRAEENINIVTDAYLNACSILNKRHEKMYQRIIARFKNATNIQQIDKNFDK